MNFGNVIKKEIISKSAKDKCCKKAFLAGYLRGSGVLVENNGEIQLDFTVSEEEIASFLINSFKILFSYDIREVSVEEDRLNKKEKFTLTISGENAIDILLELGIFSINGEEIEVNLDIYKGFEKECCLRSFLRGLFLSAGNCTVPSKKESATTGYHAEIAFFHNKPAMQTLERLAKLNVHSKITRRKERYVLYVKSVEEIKNFIALLQAPVSVLKLTDLMIERELTNMSNRQKNCDLGNVNRQIEATEKQISAINKLEKEGILKTLKKDIYLTAVARKENPDDNMSELAERLGITKSCLNHRLRKIVSLAEDTKE